MSSPVIFAESRHDEAEAYRQPLSVAARLGVVVAVIVFHVGGGWALAMISPTKLVVGEPAAMQVSMVSAEQAAPPEQDPDLPTPPDDTPPPDIPPPPQLESMIQPPMPDLPPPAFPVEAPPPKPKPPPPKPKPKPHPVQHPVEKAPPQQAAPPAAAAAAPAGPPGPPAPKTLSDAQVGYLDRPSPIYPTHSRRSGEQGLVLVKVLIDTTGRPAQVSVQKSSGFPALDESAVSALKAARFRPYVEGGVPQTVWVTAPINFRLQ